MSALKRVQPLLGTYVEISLQGDREKEVLQACATEGFNAIKTIDHLMSRHRPDSDLMRLNRTRAGTWIRLNSKTCALLKVANKLRLDSKGAFDIRAQTGIQLSSKSPPAVEISGEWVRKNGAWNLNLDGIAKGYAVDYAIKKIRSFPWARGVSGLINAGGDLRIWGTMTASVAVHIAGDPDSFQSSHFPLRQIAMATSSIRTGASTANFSEAAHIHMPSGKKAHAAQTVTVFARHCFLADALTKIVLLAPASNARRCLMTYDARALIFRSDGTVSKVMAS